MRAFCLIMFLCGAVFFFMCSIAIFVNICFLIDFNKLGAIILLNISIGMMVLGYAGVQLLDPEEDNGKKDNIPE